jgi:CheY-like chemotaxis protein
VLPEQRFLLEVASDGEECLHILRTQPNGFDLLLLDLMMPEVSGYEVLKEMTLAGVHRELPVLILTNFPEPATTRSVACSESGLVLDVLPKTSVHENPQLLAHIIDWHLQVAREDPDEAMPDDSRCGRPHDPRAGGRGRSAQCGPVPEDPGEARRVPRHRHRVAGGDRPPGPDRGGAARGHGRIARELAVGGRSVSGVDLCRLLRADPATGGVPIVLATAHAMRGDAEQLITRAAPTTTSPSRSWTTRHSCSRSALLAKAA